METADENYFEINKDLWNGRVAAHAASEFYAMDSFKAGKSSLNSIERNALGDVKDKSLLHLQCHFGQDSLSWVREGARVTGVDFSEESIKYAEQLSEELNIPAKFICANVYDLKRYLEGKFDIVFTSYGTIGWLPDLDRWAAVVSHYLMEGGTFYIVDFHPVMWMFDNRFEKISYSYFNDGPIEEEATGSYADQQSARKHLEYGWNHSFSEILNALIRNGIPIEEFNEYPYSPYNILPDMVRGEDGYYRQGKHLEKVPLLYAIKGRKR